MGNKLDFRSLRLLPVAVFSLFVLMFVLEISTIWVRQFSSVAIFLNYVSVLAVLLCLYRLNDSTEWFHPAWMSFLFHLIVRMLLQLIARVDQISGGSLVVRAFYCVAAILPVCCLALGIFFVLNGMIDFSNKMSDEQQGVFIRKVKKVWVIFQMVRILVLLISGIAFVFWGRTFLFVSLAFMICNTVVGMVIYKQARKVCQSYYLYAYNHM